MKVLVTGGAGFIGSNLCRRLLSDDGIDNVSVIDNLSTGFRENLEDLPVDLHVASILDEDSLREAAEGATAIVHLAALGSVPRSVENPVASHAANATGTLMVLEAARAVGNAHVVLASSSSVYGANPAMPKREDLQCMPMSPYAVSKLAAEQYAMAFANCYGLPVLPFRFFNVYGPRQRPGHAYAAVIPAFLDAALREVPVPLNGDGSQSRDFTFVDTVTDVITLAITRGVTSSPTNLAFGTRTDLLEVMRIIEQEAGVSIEIDYRPERAGDVKHSQANNDLLRTLFADVTPVGLESGINQTAEWMRQHLSGV